MNIIIGESSNINQGSSGLITGEIYFEESNQYFPEKGWSDFPIIILGWWISSFLNFIKENSKTFEFSFMDGPFKVIGLLIKNEKCEVHFLRQYEEGNEQILLGYVNKKEIQNMLLKTSRKLFRIAELSNISDDKLVGLKKLFNELKELQL